MTVPFASVAVPMTAPPSANVTVPVSADGGAPGAAMVAVSCVVWRTMMVAGAATSANAGAMGVTLSGAPGVDVLGAKMPEPEKTAVML